MLLLAVMMSVSMSAEVLFFEDFSAGVGTLVESNNGWFTPYDGASGVSITNGLGFPDYVMSGVGNAVLLDGDCGQYQPHHSFAEVSQGSVYVAFMFQPSIIGKAGWFFCLRDSYSQSTFNYVARIHLSADGLLGLRFYKTAEAVFDETIAPRRTKHLSGGPQIHHRRGRPQRPNIALCLRYHACCRTGHAAYRPAHRCPSTGHLSAKHRLARIRCRLMVGTRWYPRCHHVAGSRRPLEYGVAKQYHAIC